MAKIIIGFSTPKKFHIFPAMIKLVERTEFSHTYIKITSDSLERQFIYQASGLHVNFMNLPMFLELNYAVQEFEVDITPETYKKVLQFAIDNVGVPYSLKQIFGLAWSRLLKNWFGYVRRGNIFANGSKGSICTELVVSILNECLNVDIREEFDSVGLRECYQYAQRLGKEATNV